MVSKELRDRVIEDSGSRCALCRRAGGPLALHHIDPHGPDTYENLIALCPSCHALAYIRDFGPGELRAHAAASRAYQLEIAAAHTLLDAGFAVISGVTGPDAGVDIVAHRLEPGSGDMRTFLAECKGGQTAIGGAEVAAFAAKLSQYAGDFGVIIVTVEPSAEALETARGFGVSIVPIERFAGFIKDLQGNGDSE